VADRQYREESWANGLDEDAVRLHDIRIEVESARQPQSVRGEKFADKVKNGIVCLTLVTASRLSSNRSSINLIHPIHQHRRDNSDH
jgi:hypothetical protein